MTNKTTEVRDALHPQYVQFKKDPGMVMMSAFALCPSEKSHPEKMAWIADYFISNAIGAPAAANKAAEEGELPALPEGDEFSHTRMLQSGDPAPRYRPASMREYARQAIAPGGGMIDGLHHEFSDEYITEIAKRALGFTDAFTMSGEAAREGLFVMLGMAAGRLESANSAPGTPEAPADVRKAALEEAAAIAEKIADDYSEKQGGKWPELRDDAATGAGDCASAIRERAAQLDTAPEAPSAAGIPASGQAAAAREVLVYCESCGGVGQRRGSARPYSWRTCKDCDGHGMTKRAAQLDGGQGEG